MNSTMTRYHILLRIKRHIVLWAWDSIQDIVHARLYSWQPSKPCISCHAAIHQQAHFCSNCGTCQLPPAPPQEAYTEEINLQVLEPDTQRLYTLNGSWVRMGQLRPFHAYRAELKRREERQDDHH